MAFNMATSPLLTGSRRIRTQDKMNMNKKGIPFRSIGLRLCVLGMLLAVASGCASAAVGAGAAVGAAAFEERDLQTVAQDTATAAKVRLKMVDAGEKYVTNIGIEVFEGRVLLTGAVPDESMRVVAIREAWEVEGVKDVLNEIQVSDAGFVDMAKDSWVTAQLTSKLTLDRSIHAINYAIETVNGTIYLIGIALDQGELDRVIAHARSIGYARRVISHVRVKETAS